MSQITAETVKAMLERKKRSMARKAEQTFEISNPYDAVGKAVSMAQLQGAVEVLEEMLFETAGGSSEQEV